MRVWRLRPLIHSASASLHVIVKGLAAEFPNATAEVQRQLWIKFYSQSLPKCGGKSKSDIGLQTPDMEPTAAAPPGGSFEVAYQQQRFLLAINFLIQQRFANPMHIRGH